MNNCTVCDDCFRNDNPNKIICDGICRQSFHAECVNFGINALSSYREMPNLQWFCDGCIGCIIQTRTSNVSSSQFNKFNSTVVIPTSSPSYIQRSLKAAKRNRNPLLNAKRNNSSVFLSTQSPNVEHDTSNANDSKSSSTSVNQMQPENHLVKSFDANGSNPMTTSVITQPEIAQPKPQHNSVDFEEPLELETTPANSNSSSFADVLTKSSIAEPVPSIVENSTIKSQNDRILPQRIVLRPPDPEKVVYVSRFHPSVTEKEVVNYLLKKNIITSAEEVYCKKLVSPDVDLDSITFASFKITVDSKIFSSVVKGELWPDGVITREFVNR